MSTSIHELHYLTATEQAQLIKSGQISPVELLEAYLDRIECYDDALRAWITVDREFAMEQARQAEQEITKGHYRGPLHGLPYGVKDQMHTLGLPTTLGTKVLDPEEMQPPHDATIITRLREAGAVLVGKQNLHEFGKGGTIEFPYGQPRNPWNPAHTASSSSTGSGIATAAGQCSFSIGEDTGGSVRGPASCNGVVGLRPTHGRVSRHGGVMAAYTSDTFGPLTRSVEDCASVLQAIAGHDPKDPLCIPREVPNFSAQLGHDLKGLKLAVVKEIAWGEATHPEVRDAMVKAIQILREQGAVVEEISLPLAKWAVPLQLLSADADVGAYFLANYLRDRYQRFDVGTRTRLAAASLIPATVYNRAMRARVLVRRQVLDALRHYDALITPTNVTPPKLIEDTQERVDGDQQDVVARLIERRICHYPFSLSNVPALSVPAGFSTDGLPLALQIAGRPFDEQTVFQVGHAFQQASAWHRQHPALDTTLKGVA